MDVFIFVCLFFNDCYRILRWIKLIINIQALYRQDRWRKAICMWCMQCRFIWCWWHTCSSVNPSVGSSGWWWSGDIRAGRVSGGIIRIPPVTVATSFVGDSTPGGGSGAGASGGACGHGSCWSSVDEVDLRAAAAAAAAAAMTAEGDAKWNPVACSDL